ncbi:transglycosylase domain-containing protein [Candidatus Nomurabacteria bacterium]|uniref:Transglycosylase domain-containing protein n=1 Tax=candidate division WWE3 bacterium TaxID=2053526 RepID=A0A955E2V0_UNCKA|nr:transglycosylase domain-containing protein [candidate division WWE3 bacterium]MCB9823741.1 transglycosylase domain-containing protein [Candidatus Nomurabacteria bacterium]MCB9827180.1 transglycosylase domain-containing protein [Candidatus Nomurabacteria bacterium]MCB9827536.1 transglycosylase domain-containing protein [Candidatus Nomurabacteria bacterium]
MFKNLFFLFGAKPKYRSIQRNKKNRFKFIPFDKAFGKSGEKVKIDKNNVSPKLLVATYLATGALIAVILGIVVLIIVFATFSRDLPDPNKLLERDRELSTRLYDRNGKPLFEVYGEKNRQLIQVSDVSPNLVYATLATEDANFYSHRGFFLKGMLRALVNMVKGEGLQSGSTITQQVAKNAALSQDRTITRKVKEIILALQLENKYSKEQILQMYLNETPYGGQNYGVLTAAKAYFNKHPRDLTLAEAAYIAGLPQSPTSYSFYGPTPEKGIARKNYVLSLLKDYGWQGEDGKRHYITEEEYERAANEELLFQKPDIQFEAPHFVFYTKDYLSQLFGPDMVEQGGLQVTTTLDLDLQREAEKIVREEVDKSAYLNVGNGALVAVQPGTGNILAMVGSKDYSADSAPEGCTPGIAGEDGCVFDPNVNVTTSLRQPGSSIKPITYATMLEQGYTAAYPFLDVESKFAGSAPDKPYIPKNYDGKYRGPMSMRRSLANSLNIPAVKALEIVGIQNMLNTAEEMGITTLTRKNEYGLSLALGAGETKLLEMTNAFAVFANNGEYATPTPIIEVKNARGEVIYKAVPAKHNAISPETAFIISDILSDDGARSDVFGTGSLLNIPGHKVAVKTGTTNDLRDNYAVGYTPIVAVGVWVGNNNNEAMSNVASGITGATPIYHRFMAAFLEGKEEQKFEAPSNVEKVTVDSLTGMLPYADFSQRPEWFIKGTEPTSPSEWYQRIEICKPDGLLASQSCREADKTSVETFIDIQAELEKWQVYVDKWIGENFSGDSKYFPPRTVSSLKFDGGDVQKDTNPVVSIANFKNGSDAPLEFRLKVEVSSPNDIDYVKIYLDGNEVTKDKSEPFGYNFTFTSADVGKHEFKASAVDEDGREGDVKISLEIVPY